MRKANANSLLCLPLVLVIIGLMTTPAHGVIFASDALYLYRGGERIADNSILILRAGSGEDRLDVCTGGSLWLRQGPTWKPGPHIFIRTRHSDTLTFQKWIRTPEARASEEKRGDEIRKDYQQYLKKKAADALSRVEITIPTVAESPALDRSPSPPPRPGMTGGKIGHDRFFRVDLDTGAIEQVPRDWILGKKTPAVRNTPPEKRGH